MSTVGFIEERLRKRDRTAGESTVIPADVNPRGGDVRIAMAQLEPASQEYEARRALPMTCFFDTYTSETQVPGKDAHDRYIRRDGG